METNTYINFSYEAGITCVHIDRTGVSFCDGYAYFSGFDGQDYKVPVQHLLEIGFV